MTLIALCTHLHLGSAIMCGVLEAARGPGLVGRYGEVNTELRRSISNIIKFLINAAASPRSRRTLSLRR